MQYSGLTYTSLVKGMNEHAIYDLVGAKHLRYVLPCYFLCVCVNTRIVDLRFMAYVVAGAQKLWT